MGAYLCKTDSWIDGIISYMAVAVAAEAAGAVVAACAFLRNCWRSEGK